MNLGDAFLLKEAISDHIWVVSYQNSTPIETIIIFSFTTYREGLIDTNCIIKETECPVLNYDSVVSYRFGKVFEGEDIKFLETNGVRRYLPSIEEKIIKKIQHGAIKSKFTPGKIKKLIHSII